MMPWWGWPVVGIGMALVLLGVVAALAGAGENVTSTCRQRRGPIEAAFYGILFVATAALFVWWFANP
jgi:hypothetical protein